MQVIETAWKQWFGQFAPYVYAENDAIIDPTNILYPRITFSYIPGNMAINAPGNIAFQIWTWSNNKSQLWDVENKISEAMPSGEAQVFPIFDISYFEYKHPVTGQWISFEKASDFQAIAEKFPGINIDWRSVEGQSSGGYLYWRTSNWMQPSPKDEPLSIASYSVIQLNDWTLS